MTNVTRHTLLRTPALPGALAVLLALVMLAPAGGEPAEPAVVPGSRDRSPMACSLTTAQERAALDAFDQMLPVISHPRCANCHGGVNPYADPAVGRHLGGNMIDSTGQPIPASGCQDCHSELPGWDLPGQAMFFVGRTTKELCMQFKQFAPGGGAEFVEHIQHEPGLPQFIKTAFLGTRALNTLGEVTYQDQTGHPPVPEKPPGDLGQLVSRAQAWVHAIGNGWTQSPECGCTTAGAWHGTIKASGEFLNTGIPGLMRVSSQATVVFEPIENPSHVSGNRVQNYRATGGIATWDAIVTGQCRGQAAGSVPLDVLDIDGNPMAELRLEIDSNGDIEYRPTTGSLPEQWAPMFTVQCRISGTVLTMPSINMLPTWWHYDIPNPPTSNDPDRLLGRYLWDVGSGSKVLWEWDLKRTR